MNPVRLLVASIAFAALLTAGSAQTFEVEPNNTTGQANLISSGVSVRGQLMTPTDADYFSVVTLQAGILTIKFADGNSRSNDGYYIISFLNAAGSLLASYSKFKTSSNGVQSFGIPSAGTYYIRIDADPYLNYYYYSSEQYAITATFGPVIPLLPSARLINLSVLTPILSGQPLTAGFVLSGSESKRVLIRAIGPTLSTFGVVNPVSDPTLILYDPRGVIIGSNDDWQSSNASTMASSGAFALPAGSRDAVIVVTLVPGAYTTAARGFGNASGMVLIEVYEAP